MQKREEKFTLYKLLNIEPTATLPDIKKSYRQLALQLHPDKNQEDKQAKEKFQKISEAYQILSNEEKRKLYDETGLLEGMEEFQSAYEHFRNLYPKITKQDIINYEEKYRCSQEEETDLIEYYNKNKGNVKNLLESIILSRNEDIPRFLKFFDEQISEGKLQSFKAYQTSRNKIKTLREEKESEWSKAQIRLIYTANGGEVQEAKQKTKIELKIILMKIHYILAGLCVILNTINCSKISNKNILLPLADTEVEYEITAEGGCFDWSTSNSAIQVNGQNNQGCSKSVAKVKVVTRVPSQTFIYVKSPASQQPTFVVEVVVGSIASLSIVTKQKQLDLDTQEELHVQAQDEKGNTFTTLEGLKFQWDVQDLIMVKFSESGLKVSEKRAKLEFNSDIIVVKGRKMGKVRVTTQVIEDKYRSKQITTYVDLVVIEKFQFFPDYPVYYLPTYSKINFQLLRADGTKKIKLPSQFHKWSVSSKESSVEQNGILTTNNVESHQFLQVTNTSEASIQAVYYVVNPKAIDIDIWEDGKERRDEKVTHLVVGRLYRFQAYLTYENNRLYSSDTYEYSSTDITLEEQTVKSEIERQNVVLHFKLANNKLSSSVRINFVKQISIETVFQTYIHLPVNEKYQLDVSGGSGDYVYQQKYSSPNIFDVQSNIMASLQVGENVLYIYDKKNNYNNLEVKVYVSDLTKILPLEQRKELIVNEEDDTYYQALGNPKYGNYGNYTWCKSVVFTIMGSQLSVSKISSNDLNYLICSGLNLKSSTPGQYNLIINSQNAEGKQQLKVYNQMQLEKPLYLVTPYSTITTKVFGGPTSWDQNPFIEDLSEGIIRVSTENYHFNCFKQDAEFIISRVNRKSDLLPNPKLIRSRLPVKCVLPDAFKVLNEQKQEINWLFRDDKVLVTVIAVLRDEQFYNSSSLQLDYNHRGLLFSQERVLEYDLRSGISNCKFIVSSNRYNNYQLQFPTIKTELDFFIHHQLKLIPSGEQYVLLESDVNFQIQSSTQNIQCYYYGQLIKCEKDSVTVTPRQVGRFKLQVYDASLNYSVSAILNVVEPDQLRLELSQQVAVIGGQVNATSLFLYGNQKVYVTNWQQLQLVEQFNFTIAKRNNQFIINPNKLGYFKIQTQLYAARSNGVELQVIPKLNLDAVYMPQHCETHVVLSLQSSQFTISLSSPQIPELDVFITQNVITIRSKGITGTFYLGISLSQTQLIDTVQLQVVVDQPNLVSLLYGRKIELGATVRVVADFQIQNHPMSLCLCPRHKIQWKQDEKVVQSGPNLMGLSISAVVLGKMSITVEAYNLKATTFMEVDRLNSYTRNLFIDSQALYHIPLLIPPRSTHLLNQEIQSVEKLTFNPPNQIISDGITLKPQLLMATTPMLIQVQEIYQIYATSQLINVRVEEKFILPINYLNQEGYQFENVEETKFVIQGYTRNVVQVRVIKNSLEITGIDQGLALIKVSSGSNPDYIMVKVGVTLTQVRAFIGSTIKYEIDGADQPQWESNCGLFKGNLLTVVKEQNDCFVEVQDQGNKFRAALEVVKPQYVSMEPLQQLSVDQYLQVKLQLYPSIPTKSTVNPNIQVEVKVDKPEWFEVGYGKDPLEFQIKPLTSTSGYMPRKVTVYVTVSNAYFRVEGTKELLFERQFVLQETSIRVTKSEPTQVIRVPFYRNIQKLSQDSHLQGLINTQYVDGFVEITLDFSQCHEESEGVVIFENEQKLKITFTQSSNYDALLIVIVLAFFVLMILTNFR